MSTAGIRGTNDNSRLSEVTCQVCEQRLEKKRLGNPCHFKLVKKGLRERLGLRVGEQRLWKKKLENLCHLKLASKMEQMPRDVNEQRLGKRNVENPCCQIIKQSLWAKRLGYLCHAKFGSWLQITWVNR